MLTYQDYYNGRAGTPPAPAYQLPKRRQMLPGIETAAQCTPPGQQQSPRLAYAQSSGGDMQQYGAQQYGAPMMSSGSAAGWNMYQPQPISMQPNYPSPWPRNYYR